MPAQQLEYMLLLLLRLFSYATAQSNASRTAQLLYQYQPITWAENLAIRPNGNILPITTTSPLLNQLDPSKGDLELIHDFSAHGNAIQGITAVGHDAYVLDVLTCNTTALTCTPGSVTAWLVSFADGYYGLLPRATVRHLAAFPKAGFLNGMAALGPRTILIADSYLGGIWSLSTITGATSLLFTDDSMAPTPGIATGINGLRVRPGVVYFTNSAKGTFNALSIDPQTGEKTGESTVVASGLAGPDDFDIDDATKKAYVCNGALNQLLEIPIDSKNVTVAEPAVFAELPGPTSVRWASTGEQSGRRYGHAPKDGKMLYARSVGLCNMCSRMSP